MLSLLTIILVILKVTNKINWRWRWVFSPLILYAIIVIITLLFSVTLGY